MTFRTLRHDRGRNPVSGRTRLTVRVHPRARAERLEWDGSTLQL